MGNRLARTRFWNVINILLLETLGVVQFTNSITNYQHEQDDFDQEKHMPERKGMIKKHKWFHPAQIFQETNVKVEL